MTDYFIQQLVHMLIISLMICTPILLTILIVGVLINVFQVVTQLQEMSLSFIPKLIALGVILGTAGPWMLHTLINFAADQYLQLQGLH